MRQFKILIQCSKERVCGIRSAPHIGLGFKPYHHMQNITSYYNFNCAKEMRVVCKRELTWALVVDLEVEDWTGFPRHLD